MYFLNFQKNIGHSLFDTLLVWLPHWYIYRNKAGGNFPFKHVVSDSLYGCLESSTFWLCEILRSMDAFGTDPLELPPPPNANTTLYCYETLYVSHVALQRNLRHPDSLPKSVFDEFRDVMFERYSLPRNRNGTVSSAAGTVVKNEGRRMSGRVSILLYAHEPSGRRVWEGMNDLVDSARTSGKYSHVDFTVVRDFDIPIQEQATLFNAADGLVMTREYLPLRVSASSSTLTRIIETIQTARRWQIRSSPWTAPFSTSWGAQYRASWAMSTS